MRIRDKIKKPQRPVVAYEILPPREKDGTLNSYAETISSLLSQTHIDAINIPEVHDEVGRGERPVSNQERGEPRKFVKVNLSFAKLFSSALALLLLLLFSLLLSLLGRERTEI